MFKLPSIAGAVKDAAKGVEHIVHDEVITLTASEQKLAPILQKVDPNLLAQLIATLSHGKITPDEVLVIEAELPVLLTAATSAYTKLAAAAK
jgi:2-phospho-L-lactate guanylyltransferase (CobY/MobA/RfbA family)